MDRFRVALCITDLDIGGAEQCLVELATRLDRRSFDPVVYCLGPRPARGEASCTARLEAAGVPFHCLGARAVRHAPSAIVRLRRLFAEHRPDLAQTFLFHANIIGRVAARLAGVPHVVCGIRVAERQSRWHLWADRLTAGLVDRYVCVSEAVARFSQLRGGLPRGKLTVIPNGIDLRRYPAERPADLSRWGIPPGRRAVTFVGRLDRQKGVRWLLQTAPLWLSRLPDCDLLLVGTGPEESALRRATRQMGIERRVHFAGWQSAIPAILAASDLLVLPSRWEGMPNVVLQAMASRLPVLATDVEGVREVLGDAADAQSVGFGSTQQFAARLIDLMSNRARSAELGAKNRRRVEAHFGVERMVAAHQDLWRSLGCGK